MLSLPTSTLPSMCGLSVSSSSGASCFLFVFFCFTSFGSSFWNVAISSPSGELVFLVLDWTLTYEIKSVSN